MKTREEQLLHLQELGVDEESAQWLVGVDAHLRHEARVEATLEAARNAPCGLAEGLGLLLLDLIGWGGERGTGWNGRTERYRLFSKLGKGRWQASDGDAYRAAAFDVIDSHQVRVSPELEGDGLRDYGIKVETSGLFPVIDEDYLLFGIEEVVDMRILALCKRALWQQSFLEGLVETRPPWMSSCRAANCIKGPLSEWSELFKLAKWTESLWLRRSQRAVDNEAIMEPLRNTGWFRDISIRDELDGEQSPKIVAHPAPGWPTSNPPAYLTLPAY